MAHKQRKKDLATILLSICISLGLLSVTNTRALELDMTEALVDLLGRTSFDAAGSHRNYNRLLLWDYGSDVNLFVDQDVDGISHKWVAGTLSEIARIVGSNASIRFNVVANPFDAQIVVVSAREKSGLESIKFYEFMNKRFGMTHRGFRHFVSDMNRLYSDPSYAWTWPQIMHDKETGKKRITGFLAVIEPKEKSFKLSFSKVIFQALGYGNGSYLTSRIRSVQTHAEYNTNEIEGVDFSILHFLYNSQAKNGMEKTSALKLFRAWMKSDEFRKLHLNFVRYK